MLAGLTIRRFWLQKADTPRSEFEDAIASNRKRLRFAVADGATEGFHSRRWARDLVAAWVTQKTDVMDPMELGLHVQALGERLHARTRVPDLPWYLEEKARQGAFAAFVGLQVRPSGLLDAVAVGDCCLVHESRDDFFSFPLATAEEFNSRPVLVPSRIGDYPASVECTRQCRRTSLPGDCILLMSDALACWYLTYVRGDERLHRHFHDCLSASDRPTLTELVGEERAAKRLRNDDVAVLRLDMPS